jgi:hypothetical protein
MKNFSFLFLLLFAFFVFSPPEIFACACCAERGEYSIRTTKPTEYELKLLNNMRFEKATEIFTTEAGFETIKGLPGIEKDLESLNYEGMLEFFNLESVFAAKTWRFNFKTKTGKTGTLVLPLPAQMLSFKADIHDGKVGGGGGPLLYKEWRFKGNVKSGSGFFKAGIVPPTSYFLVLQGRGNNCDNAEDFKNWRLEIDGKNADYAFFGKMSDPQGD